MSVWKFGSVLEASRLGGTSGLGRDLNVCAQADRLENGRPLLQNPCSKLLKAKALQEGKTLDSRSH